VVSFFVFPQRIFAIKNAGIKAGVLKFATAARLARVLSKAFFRHC